MRTRGGFDMRMFGGIDANTHMGMTGLDPDVRFDKHKAGIQANTYVQKYGLRLIPDHYEAFTPMAYEQACDMKVEIGIDLREAGFGVWQA